MAGPGGRLTVYAIPPSLYCAKLRILLRHKRLDWEELPPPGGYGSDEYKRTVPSGNLPALVDGTLQIADSEAIAEYLEEKHPNPPMLPDTPAARAKVRERSRFHDTRLEPALRVLFPHIASGDDTGGIAERQSTELSARLGQLGRMLADTPPDRERLDLGDCGYPVTFAWIDGLTPVMGLDIDWPGDVIAYREILLGKPAVKEEMSRYQMVLDEWLKTRTRQT